MKNNLKIKNKFYNTIWFTVLMLILFFPVGIFLMFKNNLWTKKVRLIITTCFVILTVIATVTGEETPVEVPKEKEPITKVEEPAKEEPVIENLTLTQKIENNIKSSTKDATNIVYTEVEGEANPVVITLNLSDNISNKWMRDGAFIDAEKIVKSLSTTFMDDISSYQFMFNTNLVDKYGNESVGKVMSFDFDKADIEQINWSNMYADKFSQLAKNVWIHPALRD